MREAVIQWFSEALQSIPAAYLRLETMDGPIVRERVFCYELYHKLRNIQENNSELPELTPNGEIDKSGHSEFRDFGKNPDFVFHHPGTMNKNIYVIEVKGKINATDIQKDFDTLLTFIGDKAYSFGLFILYNHTMNELGRSNFNETRKHKYVNEAHRIDILCISDAEVEPERNTLHVLLQEQHQ